jgi:predicted Zn-dependent protease
MTLARESGFQPAVEKLFFASLEREPHDAELRYALASYYRRAGMAARAILQLRLVLSADSGHAAAWRDLGELEAGESRRGR